MKSRLLGAFSASLFAMTSIGTAHATAVSGQGTWESTLQGRDLDNNLATFEAYYETTLDITWLADANYAGAAMNWSTASAWATGLDPYGSGITGWRLPTTVDVGNNGPTYTNINQGVDYGFNITTHSEMSYMFYVTLGNTAYYNTSGVATGCTAPNYCLTNTGSFSNLQSLPYWSATGSAVNTFSAWFFRFNLGAQLNGDKSTPYYAWAVHPGDVGASAVPVPAAAWLFCSGLLGLLGVVKRKKAA